VKTLYLLRHAKSDWSDDALADHARPLNRRGRRARAALADQVATWDVDLVLCSTARRARDTAKPVVEALGCRVRYDDELYAANGSGLFRLVQSLSDDDHAVMLVGHNPSIEELTRILCGATPAYPTAAIGTLGLAIQRWRDLAPGCGTLVSFSTPAR
jgi:phosphohistidine phosphatase